MPHLSFSILFLFLTLPAFATDHGGDMVICGEPSGLDPKIETPAGAYTLDFIQVRHPLEWYDVPASLDESFDRVSSILETIDNNLSASFKEYRSLISNKVPFTNKRSWKIDDAQLYNVGDESLVRKLPDNCESRADNNGEPRGIYQVIVRKEIASGHIIYEANGPMLKKLGADPLQISMLHVHEWLRDYLPATYSLYHATAELHSLDAVERAHDGMLKEILINLGCLKKTPVSIQEEKMAKVKKSNPPLIESQATDEQVERDLQFSEMHLSENAASNPSADYSYLRIWAPESSSVFINEHKTRSQLWTDEYSSSRLFTFPRKLFATNYANQAVIRLQDQQGHNYQATLYISLGKQYELRFPKDFKITR